MVTSAGTPRSVRADMKLALMLQVTGKTPSDLPPSKINKNYSVVRNAG